MKKLLLMLLLCIGYRAVFAQQTISGTVTSGLDGEGLPGVSIVVKGTTIGTTTNVEGEYQLQIPADAETLVYSFIGYQTYEEAIGNKSIMDVVLYEDVQSLQEVVVVGYGTATRKELTGAVSSVSGEDIVGLNPTRIDQALQGQVAGVNISSASGSPGGDLNIRIRGLSTNGDNAPLVLVDGITYPVEGLNALNPADVESISVLKDATAAIYGVRAANGVILITTKQGRKNARPSFNFSGYYGIQETTKKLDLLTAREFAILKNEALAAGGQSPRYANVNLGDGTDWQDKVFQQAPIQNYNLNVMGGSEKSTYSIGGSYLDQEGIIGGDKSGYTRYNARVNFTTDLAPRVTLENILLYTNEERSTLPENGIGSVLYNTINAAPTASVRTDEGRFTYLEEVNDIINPLAQIANTFNEAQTNKLVGKQELGYDINDNFKLTGRAGYNYAIVDSKTFSPLVYYGSGKAQNTALNEDLDPNVTEIGGGVEIPVYNNVSETRASYFTYNLEAFLNYEKVFDEVHKVKATLGTALSNQRNKSLSGTAYNVPYNSIDFADISAAEGANYLSNTASFQDRNRLLSYFLRAEYAFQGKYLLSAILRRDASTRFGINNRVGYFPALSAAWVASDEDFFNVDLIAFLKVRGSYGVSGNDRIPNFRYRSLLGGEGVYPFDDQLVTGIALGALGNNSLKWETTHQGNIGVDLAMFNDQVNISADYYVKITYDLLFQPDVSGIVGAYGAGSAPPTINAGDIRNKGFEFLIGYDTHIGSDLNFNVTYNLTTIDNEVTGLPEGVDFIEYGSFGVGGPTATRMEIGYPIGYFFGYKTEGVYQTNEEIESRGVTQNGAQPGDLRYADISGDGVITFGDDQDKTFIGSPIPDLTMGLTLGLNYKGFDISANVYASIGNEILRNYERQQPLANLLEYKLERWTGPGSTNEHPRLTTAPNNNAVISDYFVEDGSYVRLKNLQLGYALPASVVERIGASKLRVYVSATNLFTLTDYMGYDPDFSTSNPLVSGIDYGFYPQARIFMAGLNLNF